MVGLKIERASIDMLTNVGEQKLLTLLFFVEYCSSTVSIVRNNQQNTY